MDLQERSTTKTISNVIAENQTSESHHHCGYMLENGSTCMETKTLDIFHKLNDIYRKRLQHIDHSIGDKIEVPIYNVLFAVIFVLLFILLFFILAKISDIP